MLVVYNGVNTMWCTIVLWYGKICRQGLSCGGGAGGGGGGGGSGVCNAAVSVTFLLTSHPGVCRGL